MALLVNLNGNLDSSSRDRDYRDYYSQPIYYFVPFYTYLQALVQIYEGDLLSSPLSQELPTGEYTFLDCAKTLSIPLDSNLKVTLDQQFRGFANTANHWSRKTINHQSNFFIQ